MSLRLKGPLTLGEHLRAVLNLAALSAVIVGMFTFCIVGMFVLLKIVSLLHAPPWLEAPLALAAAFGGLFVALWASAKATGSRM